MLSCTIFAFAFPVAIFVKTATRKNGVCRDALNAVWLDANYINTDQSLMYSLEDRLGTYEGVDSFVVKRHASRCLSSVTSTGH